MHPNPLLSLLGPPPSSGVTRLKRHDDLEQNLLARRGAQLELLLADADDLYTINADAHFLSRGCGSIRDYGEKILRMSARDTAFRLALGRAIQLLPGLRERILAAKVTPENAASLGLIAEHPEVVRDGDKWMAWAQTEAGKVFRRRVSQRLREAEVQEPTVEVTVPLTRKGIENLEDCQALMSKASGRRVSKAETVERSLDDWLARHDPRRRGTGPRRMPSTALLRSLGSDTRTVPASVKRQVLDDAAGKCEINLCDDSIVEFIHLTEFCEGGDQEEQNIGCLCPAHHKSFDRGLIRVEIRDGQRIWFNLRGEIIGRNTVRDAGPPRIHDRGTRPRPGSDPPNERGGG